MKTKKIVKSLLISYLTIASLAACDVSDIQSAISSATSGLTSEQQSQLNSVIASVSNKVESANPVEVEEVITGAFETFKEQATAYEGESEFNIRTKDEDDETADVSVKTMKLRVYVYKGYIIDVEFKVESKDGDVDTLVDYYTDYRPQYSFDSALSTIVKSYVGKKVAEVLAVEYSRNLSQDTAANGATYTSNGVLLAVQDAVAKSVTNQYSKVSFDVNGGEYDIKFSRVKNGEKLALPTVEPTREDKTGTYVFTGWYIKNEITNELEEYNFNNVVTGDIKLQAGWHLAYKFGDDDVEVLEDVNGNRIGVKVKQLPEGQSAAGTFSIPAQWKGVPITTIGYDLLREKVKDDEVPVEGKQYYSKEVINKVEKLVAVDTADLKLSEGKFKASIKQYYTDNDAVTTVYIPSSVTEIETNEEETEIALSRLSSVMNFEVSPYNQTYAAYGGAVYTKDLSTVVLAPNAEYDTLPIAKEATTVLDSAIINSNVKAFEVEKGNATFKSGKNNVLYYRADHEEFPNYVATIAPAYTGKVTIHKEQSTYDLTYPTSTNIAGFKIEEGNKTFKVEGQLIYAPTESVYDDTINLVGMTDKGYTGNIDIIVDAPVNILDYAFAGASVSSVTLPAVDKIASISDLAFEGVKNSEFNVKVPTGALKSQYEAFGVAVANMTCCEITYKSLIASVHYNNVCVDNGSKLTPVTQATLPDGYTFVGWTTTQYGDNVETFDFNTKVTKDMTLYAQYKVRYDFDLNYTGAPAFASVEFLTGKIATLPSPDSLTRTEEVKEGDETYKVTYTFSGWAKNETGTKVYLVSSYVSAPTKLYATWKQTNKEKVEG